MASLSASSSGILIEFTIPFLPRIAGELKQQPNSGWKWLMGRTSPLSKRMAAQMLVTTEPIPNGVDPFEEKMRSALSLHSCASSSCRKVSGGRTVWSGMPLMVEEDHATTWESPCTPNTDN